MTCTPAQLKQSGIQASEKMSEVFKTPRHLTKLSRQRDVQTIIGRSQQQQKSSSTEGGQNDPGEVMCCEKGAGGGVGDHSIVAFSCLSLSGLVC